MYMKNTRTSLSILRPIQLPDPRHGHIDMRDLIPRRKIRDAGRGQAEDGLELPHGSGGGRSVDAVCSNPRDGGVDRGDRIQLLLKLPDLLAGGTGR